VDELKTKRRPFQFSLRELLLWTAVWSVYLGIVCSAGMSLSAAMMVTVSLAILLVFRIRHGRKRFLRNAVICVSGLSFACIGTVLLDVMVLPPGNASPIMVSVPTVCLVLLFLILGGCGVVDLLVSSVDWLDNLMKTKPPQGQ
jgi:hypothetical protein